MRHQIAFARLLWAFGRSKTELSDEAIEWLERWVSPEAQTLKGESRSLLFLSEAGEELLHGIARKIRKEAPKYFERGEVVTAERIEAFAATPQMMGPTDAC